MAIITHRTSKNARYSDVLEYYSYKHKESSHTGHYESILDENGLMIERQNYAVVYVSVSGQEADPETWATACMKSNLLYKKNMGRDDRKNHEYIISHPTEDREKMSMEDLLNEGRTFVKTFFSGYDALFAVHRDTDNDHIHISINSVRSGVRPPEAWMMKDKEGQVLPCEICAGGKHQDGPLLRRQMNAWLLQYTKEHGYTAKDNNAIAEQHRTERHGNKNDKMKASLLDAASRSRSMDELQQIMKERYNMDLKISETGETISVLYPGNQKYVRLRTLGLDPEALRQRFLREEEKKKRIRAQEDKLRYYTVTNRRTGRPYSTSLYDEHGRRRSTLELLFMLSATVLRAEAEPSWRTQASASQGEQAIYAPRNWNVQRMIDSIQIAREENIQTPAQIDDRIRSVGMAYGKTKRSLERSEYRSEEQKTRLEEEYEALKKRYHRLKELQESASLAQNACCRYEAFSPKESSTEKQL